MGHQFPSQEWTDEFVTTVNHSDAYAGAAKTWEGDILFVVEGSGAIYADLWHGACRAGVYYPDPSVKTAEFQITASPAKWRQVIEGKLDPIQAMVTRQIRLDGNLVKIMKNVKAAQELVRCATQVDTDFS